MAVTLSDLAFNMAVIIFAIAILLDILIAGVVPAWSWINKTLKLLTADKQLGNVRLQRKRNLLMFHLARGIDQYMWYYQKPRFDAYFKNNGNQDIHDKLKKLDQLDKKLKELLSEMIELKEQVKQTPPEIKVPLPPPPPPNDPISTYHRELGKRGAEARYTKEEQEEVEKIYKKEVRMEEQEKMTAELMKDDNNRHLIGMIQIAKKLGKKRAEKQLKSLLDAKLIGDSYFTKGTKKKGLSTVTSLPP